jgi:hypothetical protein
MKKILAVLLCFAVLVPVFPSLPAGGDTSAGASVTVDGPTVSAANMAVNGRNWPFFTGGVTNSGLFIRNGGDTAGPVLAGPFNGRYGLRPADFLQFFIADGHPIKNAGTVVVEITYYDNAPDAFWLEYTRAGNAHSGVSVPRSNTNQWRTERITLEQCAFATLAQGHGQHIRISGNPIIHSLRITEPQLTDSAAVQSVKDNLVWDSLKNENTLQGAVTGNLNLPATGGMNTTVTWASSNTAVIAANGTVTRPVADTTVTLTATIRRGPASDTKQFVIGVRGRGTGTDAQAVADARARLTWDSIKGMNLTQNNITTNLVLPAEGFNQTDITWVSGTASVISHTGILLHTRPDAGANVALTATIRRGSASETRTFTLSVPGRYEFSRYIRDAVTTQFPTKDWVISDFNVQSYGAKTTEQATAEGLSQFCNRLSFQAAIDAAFNNGGGVVYAPAGHYAFYTEADHSRTITTTTGEQTLHFKAVLSLHESVQLRGDWADPEENNGRVRGTVLAVYAGRNSPRSNLYVPHQWVDHQAGSAIRNTYVNASDRFIQMRNSAGVTNLSVWYPEQDINNVVPYPWTLFQTDGNSATVENVTLVNSYGGFVSAPSECHYVVNSYMTALNAGIKVHICTDIGRIENVKIDPKYWAQSGLPGAPSLSRVTAYTKANATGFEMHRSDWEYVAGLHISGYKTGIWIGREPGFDDTPNAQFFQINVTDCVTALDVEAVNSYGLLISDSVFEGGTAVRFSELFDTSTQFNGVDFRGPVVSNGRGGVISFESCTFRDYGSAALTFSRGTMLVTQSEFRQAGNHVRMTGSNTAALKSVNSGYNFTLNVNNTNTNSSTSVERITDPRYTFEPIPRGVSTEIAVHPRPSSRRFLRADLPRVVGSNNNRPTVDVSARLQEALNAVAAAGGGTVYLPGGRYLVNSPITVPSGVELRGSWDVQHHTQGGGTAIFTDYAGGSAGENGTPLIRLRADAGLRGLKVHQNNLVNIDGFTPDNPRKTPFLMQGQGANVYFVNVTVPLGDKGIDLFSYNTSGHYVDYFAGTLMRAGIWVGGGATGGYIRNMQFNPHYALRYPSGGHGYQRGNMNPDHALYLYTQGHCSALKFSDVKHQTIFNNFVFGTVYGVHFQRDAKTGNFPGEITMIGHGSDGCTYALYVEDADRNTRIVAINSELVNTHIRTQPIRAYVRMGDTANTTKVHPESQLILYNSAFWGSPTVGAIINNGTVRFQQANFEQTGNPAISLRGGNAHVYSSRFLRWSHSSGTFHTVAAVAAGAGRLELTNNSYDNGGTFNASWVQNQSGRPNGIYGSDPGIALDLTPTVEPFTLPSSSLTAMQNAQVKGMGSVFRVRIEGMAGVPMTASLPYTLKPGETNPAGVQVWHLDSDGYLHRVGGTYNQTTRQITFTTTRQGFFAVGYDPVALWTNRFTDVPANHPLYDAIAYAVYHDDLSDILFAGTGLTTFAPETPMTREMFAMVVYKMEGRPAPKGSDSFTDVPQGRWSFDAVRWAAENNIVAGVGNNQFAPERMITRQEAAQLFYNYSVRYKGDEIPLYRDMPPFTDFSQVASWAQDAATQLSRAGVLSPYDDGRFQPLRNVSRAEIALLFKNYIRLVK